MAETIHNADRTVEVKVTDMEDSEVDEKEYHTRFPGSNFIGTTGAVASFNGAGVLKTTSKLLQRELDKVADKPGSPIYTKDKPTVLPNENAPTNDIQNRAAQAVAALNAAANKG